MQRRRGRGGPQERSPASDGGDGSPEEITDTNASPAAQLRAPRHGGWKGFRGDGREAQMLRGEPGYHLGEHECARKSERTPMVRVGCGSVE